MKQETKPFYLSSETYVLLATIIVTLSGAITLSDKWKGILAASAAVAYAIARALAKSGVPYSPAPVPDPAPPVTDEVDRPG